MLCELVLYLWEGLNDQGMCEYLTIAHSQLLLELETAVDEVARQIRYRSQHSVLGSLSYLKLVQFESLLKIHMERS